MAMTLIVEIEGDSYSDLRDAINEVAKKVAEEYRSGMDANDSGKYYFEVTGDPEDEEE